jgi:hypothetical protein
MDATTQQQLDEAKVIIRELLSVLHQRSGKKKHADRARAFLGLKPGEKVMDRYERMNLSTPGWGDRWREIEEKQKAEKAGRV